MLVERLKVDILILQSLTWLHVADPDVLVNLPIFLAGTGHYIIPASLRDTSHANTHIHCEYDICTQTP